VGTEHLLLGVLGDEGSTAGAILRQAGAARPVVRRKGLGVRPALPGGTALPGRGVELTRPAGRHRRGLPPT
jgi:hypothetical protein